MRKPGNILIVAAIVIAASSHPTFAGGKGGGGGSGPKESTSFQYGHTQYNYQSQMMTKTNSVGTKGTKNNAAVVNGKHIPRGKITVRKNNN